MKSLTELLTMLSGTRVIAEGEAAGLKLATKRGIDPKFACGAYERPVQEAIASSLSPGDVFFDIGANIGFFSLIAGRRVGPQGKVYAFEPVPDNSSTIARNAQLNELDMIDVFQEAVGCVNGRAELLLARHIGGAALASAGAPPDLRGSTEVDIVALDDVIEERGLRPPSMVKIDVEGAEADVLRGMTKTLSKDRPIILYEIDDATQEGVDRKVRDTTAFLSAAGYGLSWLPESYPQASWKVHHLLAIGR